jgi:hypothetical protein
MTLAQLRRQQIRQFNLADFTLDLGVGHFRVEVMLKTRLRQQLHKQFLGQVGKALVAPSSINRPALLEARTRGMIAYDAMKLGPKAIDVGVTQTINPATGPRTSFCGSARTRHLAGYGNA